MDEIMHDVTIVCQCGKFLLEREIQERDELNNLYFCKDCKLFNTVERRETDMGEESNIPVHGNDGDVPVFEGFKPIDVSKHNGTWSEIDKIETIDSFTNYTEGYSDPQTGDWVASKYVEGLKRPVKKLKVSSKVLEVIPREGKAPIEIRATMLFSLKRKTIDGREVWGVSPNANAGLQKLMKKQKVTTVNALIGTKILITTRPASDDPEDTREYLGFVAE